MGALVWSTQAALIGHFAGMAFADQPWVAFGVAFALMAAVGAVTGVRERRHVRRERAAAAASPPDRDPAPR